MTVITAKLTLLHHDEKLMQVMENCPKAPRAGILADKVRFSTNLKFLCKRGPSYPKVANAASKVYMKEVGANAEKLWLPKFTKHKTEKLQPELQVKRLRK